MPLPIVMSSQSRQAERIVLYGVEGVGKSTWAKGAKRPLFLDVEHGLAELDVPTVPCASCDDAVAFAKEFPAAQYGTAVIDTIDALDVRFQARVCEEKHIKSIEDVGYGKGWIALGELWHEYLDLLDRCLIEKGVEVILVCHAQLANFSNPEGPDYNRYSPKLNAKHAGIVKEWASCVFFAYYEDYVKMANEKANRGKAVTTRLRKIFTSHSAAKDGKNRLGLPPSIDMQYSVFADLRDKFWREKQQPAAGGGSSAPTVPTTAGSATPAVVSPQAEEKPEPKPKSEASTEAPDVALRKEVSRRLGLAQKDFDLTMRQTAEQFVHAVGIQKLSEGSTVQLNAICELIQKAYAKRKEVKS